MDIYQIFLISLALLAFSAYSLFTLIKNSRGNERMLALSQAIEEGAYAFILRQYKTILPIALILSLLIGIFIKWEFAFSFLIGVISSALAVFIGMSIAVSSNSRVAHAANEGIERAFSLAMKGGSSIGIAVVALALIALSLVFIFFETFAMISFAFGAALTSLFVRVGGGIYTKAADVGADLVGKVEKNIPEDDPRNPAVIADNVGDNVGDCAGTVSDIFASLVSSIAAAIVISKIIFNITNEYLLYPLILASLGALASLIGILFIRLQKNIMHSFYIGLIIASIAYLLLTFFLLPQVLFAVLLGSFLTLSIFLVTQYYTGKEFYPVQEVAKAATSGAGTNIIYGLAIGMQSLLLPALLLLIGLVISYKLFGIYGVALTAIATLSFAGIVLAIDSYGPITDNAGGIAEMSEMPQNVRNVTDELDAVGNTTKATTKGFAILGAGLASLVLFTSLSLTNNILSLDFSSAKVILGLILGIVTPFLFSSFLLIAVGRAAFAIVEEVRRQFKEIPGILEARAKPDYGKAVDISTKAALNELFAPALIALVLPLVIGYLFGGEVLLAFLRGAFLSAFALALLMSTSGAVWDNAKKFIEAGNYGGKKSEPHKAAVIGDTVGDPFKDTAGPSMNALLQVMHTASLVFASIVLANSIFII